MATITTSQQGGRDEQEIGMVSKFTNLMDYVCGMLFQDAESEDYDDTTFGGTVYTLPWSKVKALKADSGGRAVHFKTEQEARENYGGRSSKYARETMKPKTTMSGGSPTQEARENYGGRSSKYARETMKPKTTMSVGSSTYSKREQEAREKYGGRSSKYARETMKPKTTMSGHRRIEAKPPNKPTRTGHSRIEAKAPMYRNEPDHDKYYKPTSHKVKASDRKNGKESVDRKDYRQERSSRRYDDFSRPSDTEYNDHDDLEHERPSRQYDDYSFEDSLEPSSRRRSSHSRRRHNDYHRHSREHGRWDVPTHRPKKTMKKRFRMR